jgi:hypothetical protein
MADKDAPSTVQQPPEILAELGEDEDEYSDLEVRGPSRAEGA